MKDILIVCFVLFVLVIFSSIGLKSCSELETQLQNDGLKSIVMEIWEGKK